MQREESTLMASSLTRGWGFSARSLTVGSILESSILFLVTRGNLRRMFSTCALARSQTDKYSRYNYVLRIPFLENGTENLIPMHLQHTVPYRSAITRLLLHTHPRR